MSDLNFFEQRDFELWITNRYDEEQITLNLKKDGKSDSFISEQLIKYKKYIVGKRQVKAFWFLISGAVVGFISCLLSIINPIPELYETILYGLTTVALIIIFIGLYFLFE